MNRKVFEIMKPMTMEQINDFIQEQVAEFVALRDGIGATLCEPKKYTHFDLKNPVYEAASIRVKAEQPEDLFIRMVDGFAQRYSVVRYTQYLMGRINGEYMSEDEQIAAWNDDEACEFERDVILSVKKQAKLLTGKKRLGKAWFDFTIDPVEFILIVPIAGATGFQEGFEVVPEQIKAFTLPLREFADEWYRSGNGFSVRIGNLIAEQGMTLEEAIESHYADYKSRLESRGY